MRCAAGTAPDREPIPPHGSRYCEHVYGDIHDPPAGAAGGSGVARPVEYQQVVGRTAGGVDVLVGQPTGARCAVLKYDAPRRAGVVPAVPDSATRNRDASLIDTHTLSVTGEQPGRRSITGAVVAGQCSLRRFVAHDVWVGELIVVTGPPGAGKTTVSRILSHLFEPSARIAGDEFFGFIDQGYLAPWTAAAHHQNEIVIGAAAAAAGRLAGGGYTVIYDGVVGPWFLDAFGQATGLTRLHYAILLPPERVCLDRVASRVGHGFTDLDAGVHMYADFAQADIDSRHVITSLDTADAQAARVCERVRNESMVHPAERKIAHRSVP